MEHDYLRTNLKTDLLRCSWQCFFCINRGPLCCSLLDSGDFGRTEIAMQEIRRERQNAGREIRSAEEEMLETRNRSERKGST